jgi:hypothetical protein
MTCLLYLDASGDPGQYRGKNTRFFVLGGLICSPETTHDYAKDFNDLVDTFFPKGGPRPKKIHYSNLINNKYPWNLVDKKKFADELFDLILSNELTLLASVIDKEKHWNTYAFPIHPHNLSLEFIVEQYEHYLERNDDIGMVIADRESGDLMKSLLESFERFKEMGTSYKKLNKMFNTLFFAPSYTCPMLQTVDFVAYAVFSAYEREKSDRFDQIREKFDLHGLKIFP